MAVGVAVIFCGLDNHNETTLPIATCVTWVVTLKAQINRT